MRYYQVRVDIFENGSHSLPVVTHLFNGRTKKEAWEYHEAHVKSDKFLAQCTQRGVFSRSVKCSANYSEGWRYR